MKRTTQLAALLVAIALSNYSTGCELLNRLLGDCKTCESCCGSPCKTCGCGTGCSCNSGCGRKFIACSSGCRSCNSGCQSCTSGCSSCGGAPMMGGGAPIMGGGAPMMGGGGFAMQPYQQVGYNAPYNQCEKDPKVAYRCFKICLPKPVLPMPKFIRSTECLHGDCGCMNNGTQCSYNLPYGVGQEAYGYGYGGATDPRFNVPIRQQYTDILPEPIPSSDGFESYEN